MSANASSLTFAYDLKGIRPGSLIGIDMEMFYVWSVDDQNKTAQVEPASRGTTSASHSSGTLVEVNPRFQRQEIFNEINNELRALSSPMSGLYQMKTLEFPYSAALIGYDLDGMTDLLDIYRIDQKQPAYEEWRALNYWRVEPNQNTTDFPSGFALFLQEGFPGYTVRVRWKQSFTELVSSTDDLVSDAGMGETMQDIVPLGVLLRLGPTREIRRNFTEAQGDSKRAEEVGAGAVDNSFRWVRVQRQQRLAEEVARLEQLYPQEAQV